MSSPSNSDPIRDDGLEALICDCLDLFLSTLPPEQANIVRSVDVEGELSQSVADTLGLSLNTVTEHLILGRQALKERSAEMCTICPQRGLAGCDCQLNSPAET